MTGVLFGAVHAGSAPALDLVPLGVLGFMLCVLYRRTGSLYPCVAVHSLNNSVAFAGLEKWGWQMPVADGGGAGDDRGYCRDLSRVGRDLRAAPGRPASLWGRRIPVMTSRRSLPGAGALWALCAAMGFCGAAAAAEAPPPLPAPAGRTAAQGSMRLVIQHAHGHPAFAMLGERVVVRGIVVPYVAGQRVRLSIYS